MRKMMTVFTKILLLLLLGFSIFIIFNLVSLTRNQERFIPDNAMNVYIRAADEISQGKLQINWKYIAALDVVKNKEDFSKTNISNSKILGNKFLEITNDRKFKNTNYRLLSLDEVINKMRLNKDEKRRLINIYVD
ncbi:hypothetical protein [Clostridium sp. Marseille-Q2269]|uniref:hypothetical protein n=1 Tax=Clostridium sp. Marseille-Q2269 TaxID=2942205 RepID=UPI002072EF1D|nr:hypothetical protein [Clostridium sp. Marseille-Q2269]